VSAGKPAGSPGEVRPFQWRDLEERAPAAPPTAASAAAPAPPEPPREPGPEELLEAARREAALLVEAAREEAAVIREAARRQGLAEGAAEGCAPLEEAAGRWIAAAAELSGFKSRLYEEARVQVVELSLALVGKILGPLAEADAEAVAKVAGHALQLLSDREVVTLRVNPEDLHDLLETKPRLLQTVDGIKKLTVLEDPSVGRGGCLVETPTAEVDARLDAQLEELARALKKT
jgi:flagellar assembly protein FliH